MRSVIPQEGANAMDTIKLGIRYVVFVGGIVVYVVLYAGFLKEIWTADGAAPNLDNGAVQIAAGIGGLLAATFAVAFGIQRKDPTVNEKKLDLGRMLTPEAGFVTAVSVIVYFLVGLAATAVMLTHGNETPQEIKTPTTLFLGYLVAMFTGIVTGPGQTSR